MEGFKFAAIRAQNGDFDEASWGLIGAGFFDKVELFWSHFWIFIMVRSG